MATHHTSRPSNHLKRPLPAHARPSKPAPLSSRRTNSLGASKGSQKVTHHKEEDLEDEEVMAASFLQYCTTCEKQIIVPNNLVLYCSESCRKKDNEKTVSTVSHENSPPPTPLSNFSFDEDFQFRDIVPPRSPTAPSKRSSCGFFEQSADDNTTSGDEKSRMESEASRCLRQSQSATASAETTMRPDHRPRYSRASTSQAILSNAPSLSHTPSSSMSCSLPYTPLTTRPLPPRTNPHYHSSSYGSKSIDLVTPFTHAATAPSVPPQYSLKSAPILTTSTGVAEGEIRYAKSPIPTASSANGSLKQLFASTPH